MWARCGLTQGAPLATTKKESTGLRFRNTRLLRRVLDALLTRDAHQRVRLAMSCLAALLMLLCIGALYLAVAAGLAPARPVHVWALACTAGLVGVYVAIRSGWSQRLRDPALTLFQILSSMACVAGGYVIAGPARGVVLPVLAIVLMFGIFGLTPRQMLGVLLYGVVLFGAAVAWVQLRPGPVAQEPLMAAAYLLMVLVVLVSSTFLSLRTHAARTRLRQQKDDLARAMAQVRELATRDELTGLPNRRFMLDLLRMQEQRAQRGVAPALLAQFDLDHFKAINDTHGHAAGDAALRAFAQAMRAGIRATDVLARWGGEEFVLMAADTTATEGAQLLARLHAAVRALQVPVVAGGVVRLTVSAGVAVWHSGEGAEAVLQRADAALYAAKREGRDRIVWAPADQASPA